ncbi:MAG: 2OG-Fe(II) oxygenase [Pseudomonadota bacterium]
MVSVSETDDFYVIAHEPGAENPAIPTWACRQENPAKLDSSAESGATARTIDAVPGAFQILNLLSAAECERLIALTESLGYLEDAAVSLPRSVRHNDNATWIADDLTHDLIWSRCRGLFSPQPTMQGNKAALGLNARFRFYRYASGDYFAPHTDGSWPGSRLVNGELITNAFDDRWSLMTMLLFLSEDFDGGATRFLVSRSNPGQPARQDNDIAEVDIRTPRGGALCFPHGTHPQHCLHASEPITRGVKYIIRSDVLFEL